jgi:A/G-specific adenine glycosylase
MIGFAARLVHWHAAHGRHDLPWQRARDPYRIWVSEVMLQQTQVATAIPYYERFIARFPDIATLADADIDEVMAHWSGLGYYSRARNLHHASRLLRDDHHGDFPQTLEEVTALPGIGRSTGAAILALAFDQREAILDGNCRRVYARHTGVADATQKELWAVADRYTPEQEVAAYTQAIMDLGATVCRRADPACGACPVATDCVALAQGRVADIPAPKKRGRLPMRSTVMVVVHNDADEILLRKRPPSGIWGGLWSLPEFESEADAMHALPGLLGAPVTLTARLPALNHRFTHFALTVQPLRLRIGSAQGVANDGSHAWVSMSDTNRFGTPRPVRRILAMLESAA